MDIIFFIHALMIVTMTGSKSVASIHIDSPFYYASPTESWLEDLRHVPRGSSCCLAGEEPLMSLRALLRAFGRPTHVGHQFGLSVGEKHSHEANSPLEL